MALSLTVSTPAKAQDYQKKITSTKQNIKKVKKKIKKKNVKIKKVQKDIKKVKQLSNIAQSLLIVTSQESKETFLDKTFDSLMTQKESLVKKRTVLIKKKDNLEDRLEWYQEQKKIEDEVKNNGPSSNPLTKSKGVVYFNGHRETYYSQRVLPGGGLNIPGRHVAADGTIRDKDGYICVANVDYPRGTTIRTSLGMGKIYDTGCASGTVDIYTNW